MTDTTPTTESFSLGAVLSVTTGRLLCPIDGVYRILNFMTGDSIYTHQIPRVMDECKPHLLRQFPALAQVDASIVTPDNWQDWLHQQEAVHGDQLTVAPLPPGEHYQIDPLSELAEKVHPSKIVTVKP
jgi:hypothetical protein